MRDSAASMQMRMIGDHSGMLGRWSTLDELSKRFFKMAGETFARGKNDELAKAYRLMGEQLRDEAKTVRSTYDRIRDEEPDTVSWDRLWELLKEQGGWERKEASDGRA